ncbi:MAG: hypothetical protein ABR884_00130 [Minisyncoccia bacterium]|jgi:hypothetical protein
MDVGGKIFFSAVTRTDDEHAPRVFIPWSADNNITGKQWKLTAPFHFFPLARGPHLYRIAMTRNTHKPNLIARLFRKRNFSEPAPSETVRDLTKIPIGYRNRFWHDTTSSFWERYCVCYTKIAKEKQWLRQRPKNIRNEKRDNQLVIP